MKKPDTQTFAVKEDLIRFVGERIGEGWKKVNDHYTIPLVAKGDVRIAAVLYPVTRASFASEVS